MTWGATGVSVAYRDTTALHDVTLTVERGDVAAVVGGDGAGKTTLLSAILGTVRVSAGHVHRPPRNRTAAVVASGGVYADLTVGENLHFVADAYGLRDGPHGRRGGELLARARLDGVVDRLAGQLSGGMRQKLALAMALLPTPELLVLDEPTTGLDPVSRAELWLLLTSAAAEGAAVILSSTYLEEAERAAHLLVLDDGRALLSGTPAEVIAAMPGSLVRAAERPSSGHAWRDGRHWRAWRPSLDGPGTPLAPRLEDVVIVAQLRRVEAAR